MDNVLTAQAVLKLSNKLAAQPGFPVLGGNCEARKGSTGLAETAGKFVAGELRHFADLLVWRVSMDSCYHSTVVVEDREGRRLKKACRVARQVPGYGPPGDFEMTLSSAGVVPDDMGGEELPDTS